MRSFLPFVCAALLLAAAVSFPAPCAAQSVQSAQLIANTSDAVGVNYALTIERLDSTFWSCYLTTYTVANQPYCAYISQPYTQFGLSDFVAAGYNATVWAAVNLLAAEELTHAALLNITVQALGYAPVQPCQYTFPNITSVTAYLTQGLTFETVGTAAYAGSLNGLTSATLVQAAASIASVEARHASYLSALLGLVPFSQSGFDAAYNSSYVAQLISPFYVSQACLAATTLPMVRPFGVTNPVSAGNANPVPFTGNSTAAYGVSYTAAQQANDVLTLNYALVLEQLEAAFYNMSGTAFTPAQFTAAGYSASVPTYLQIIAANENTHVQVLTALITAYGGVPVSGCSYNFSALGFSAFSSIQSYLTYASTLEGVGVMAYDGAANTLTDTYLLQAAATIDMIEARHVAFINSLLYPTNGSAPFPTATDTPLTPQAVFQLISQAGIISCGNTSISFPTPAVPLPSAAPASNSTTGSNISSSSSTGSSSSGYSSGSPLPVLAGSSSSSSAGSVAPGPSNAAFATAGASGAWITALAAASALVALAL